MSSQESRTNVQKRRVFYIPGYDPIHPRRYRELYRKEGREQAEISGYDIAIEAKSTNGPYGWQVFSCQDGQDVQSKVEVLVWSDIVRSSMSNSIPGTYLQMLRTAWIYLSSGSLWRLMRLRKGPVIAALYPVAMLILQLVAAVLVGWILATLIFPLVGWFALVPSLALGYGLLRWFRKIDNKLFAYYLLHNYAHSARLWGRYPPEMESRLQDFKELVERALQGDEDEVLVVGHSSGANLGVSLLADLIRDGRVPENGPKLAFLSLGQVVPMVSFLPMAQRLRADLNYLCTRDEVTWIDVTAPGDGCAFALCDPVAVSGVAAPEKRWPLVLSAAFTQTLSPQRWAELRWRFFRLHFQYLCAFDRPGEYDYFRITAGPVTLADRFKGRAPSKSRIDIAVSKHRSIAA